MRSPIRSRRPVQNRRLLRGMEPLESRQLLSTTGLPSFDADLWTAETGDAAVPVVDVVDMEFARNIDLNNGGRAIVAYSSADEALYLCDVDSSGIGEPVKIVDVGEIIDANVFLNNGVVVDLDVGDVDGDGDDGILVAVTKATKVVIFVFSGDGEGGFDLNPEESSFSPYNYFNSDAFQPLGLSSTGLEGIASSSRFFLLETSGRASLGTSIEYAYGTPGVAPLLVQGVFPPYAPDLSVNGFDPYRATPVSDQISGVIHEADDLDQDGLIDYITVTDDGQLHVFTTADGGDDEFAEWSYPLPGDSQVREVTTADVDGDQLADVFVGVDTPSGSKLLMRRSTASQTPRTFSVDVSPSVIVVGDMDGSNGAEILLGDGRVQVPYDLSTTFQLTRLDLARDYAATAAIDVTGDGQTDIVAVSDGMLTIRPALRDGEFGDETPLHSLPTDIRSAVFADVTGDGRPDVLVASGDSLIALRQVDGGFETLSITAPAAEWSDLATGYIDGDDRLDVVGVLADGSGISVLMNVQGQSFAAPVDYVAPSGFVPSSLAIGNWDGAYQDDVMLLDAEGAEVLAFLGDTSGVLTAQTAFRFFATGSGDAGAIAMADLNDDGRQDLAVANAHHGQLFVLLHGGQNEAEFQSSGPIAMPGTVADISFADLNCDGWLDIVASTSGSTSISTLLNNADAPGAFSMSAAIGASGSPSGQVRPQLLVGYLDANESDDVLLFGGATMETCINSAVGAVSSGAEFSLVVRDMEEGLASPNTGQALPDGAPWIGEWSSFWVEVWGTGGGESLEAFEFTVDAGNAAFALDPSQIIAGEGVTLQNAGGDADAVTISGQLDAAGLAEGDYVLLARVKAVPLADGGVDVVADGTAMRPVSHGIVLTAATADLGDGSQGAALATEHSSAQTWAVPFDFNDDGAVNFVDFLQFASAYGSTVSTTPGEGHPYAGLADFNRSGVVDFTDFLHFASNYAKAAAADVVLSLPPTVYPYVPISAAPVVAAAPTAMDLQRNGGDEDEDQPGSPQLLDLVYGDMG